MMSAPGLRQGEEEALLQVLESIFEADFPRSESAYSALHDAAYAALTGVQKRVVKHQFQRFFEMVGGQWERYELFKKYWTLMAPRARKYGDENDEEFDPCQSILSREEALSHWIVMSVYDLTRRARALANVDDRPYWQLIATSCPWPEHSRQDGRIEHYTHEFWVKVRIPSAKLDCRCRFSALTRQEFQTVTSDLG